MGAAGEVVQVQYSARGAQGSSISRSNDTRATHEGSQHSTCPASQAQRCSGRSGKRRALLAICLAALLRVVQHLAQGARVLRDQGLVVRLLAGARLHLRLSLAQA